MRSEIERGSAFADVALDQPSVRSWLREKNKDSRPALRVRTGIIPTGKAEGSRRPRRVPQCSGRGAAKFWKHAGHERVFLDHQETLGVTEVAAARGRLNAACSAAGRIVRTGALSGTVAEEPGGAPRSALDQTSCNSAFPRRIRRAASAAWTLARATRATRATRAGGAAPRSEA